MQIPASQTASGLSWQPRTHDARTVLAMAQQGGMSELLSEILVGRGVGLEDAETFLAPTLRDALPDPFHLIDMDKAVNRLAHAIAARETIGIFGDYDVDGSTSTALLVRYFSALGIRTLPYIPDRMKEGYGPNSAAFESLIARGATLLITVDCGTMAHGPIATANARGVDVLVIDHHLSGGDLPPAYALVNPNRVDEISPHTNLAAVGVTFLVLVGLNKRLREKGVFGVRSSESSSAIQGGSDATTSRGVSSPNSELRTPNTPLKEPNLLPLLDMVALGTVADVMTLTGLNRALVAQGLKVLAQRRTIGLSALCDVARMEEAPSAYHLGFLLGPRINAGGRVGESGLGVELLTTEDDAHARALAARLDHYNLERQAIEAGVTEQALAQAETQANLPVMVLAGEGWHQGVIGIVAGRIKEKYQRPVAVIALEKGVGKGSARSVTGADFGAAVHAAHTQGILLAGGGHAMAAGFSLDAARLADFHAFLLARMEPAVTAYQESRVRLLDGWLSCQSATLELLADIARAAPYGIGNPAPRFGLRHVRVVRTDVLKEKHLRCILTDDAGSARLTAMAFNAVGTPLGEWLCHARSFHLAGEIKLNRWQGKESVQFLIDDAAKVAP